jgi:hypothetical protein
VGWGHPLLLISIINKMISNNYSISRLINYSDDVVKYRSIIDLFNRPTRE